MDDYARPADDCSPRIGNYHVDLGAERLIGAEKEGEQIAVEIKSFLNISFASEFHVALGQYINYFVELKKNEPNRTLYLAVPEETFELYFYTEHIRLVIEQFGLKTVAFNVENQTITKWIK